MTKEVSLNADDILILNKIVERHPLKNNVDRVVTGGQFCTLLSSQDINFRKSIPKLLSLRLIRENTPQEYIPYLYVDDLKLLLKNYDINGAIRKDRLVEEANIHLSNEEILSYSSYKIFYVVSEEGQEALEKYKNVIWFSEHENDIFGYGDHNAVFNSQYFFKNYNKDPLTEMIQYFKGKNPEITGKLYAFDEDYNVAIVYAIQLYTNKLSEVINSAIDNSYRRNNLSFAQIVRFNDWVVNSYIHVCDSENQKILSDIEINYNNNFKFKEIVPSSLFQETLIALLRNEVEIFDMLINQFVTIIEENYPEEEEDLDRYQKYMEQKIDSEVALLDLLIKHLDLEILEELKERIELRISECKK